MSDLQGVSLLWHVDFWDGPLAGMARYRDRDYWFTIAAPEKHGHYLLYELTDEELAYERERRRKFLTHVGERGEGGVKPMSGWHKFYDEYPPRDSKRDYTSRGALGGFTLPTSTNVNRMEGSEREQDTAHG